MNPIASTFPALVLILSLAGLAGPALAEEPAKPSPELEARPELAARMLAEKQARHDCKVKICNAFAKPDAAGGAITCDVTKTWLASQIQARFLGDKLTWPWGHAQCTLKVEISAADIAKARSEPTSTLKLAKHVIACALEEKDGKASAYDLKLSVTPELAFENGSAKSAVMNWADIEAPVLAKTAIWSATAVDANFSVIANGVANEVNDFMYVSCKQEGVEVAKK